MKLRVLAVAFLATVGSGMAFAQDQLGIGTDTGGTGGLPVHITADNGIEWRQADRVYIARGNVVAVRGRVTLYGDLLKAFYRPATKKPGGADPVKEAQTKNAPAAPPQREEKLPPGARMAPPEVGAAPVPAQEKPAKGAPAGGDEGATEIYRIEAQGNVKIVTDTQTAYADHADYDVDRTLVVLTGKKLKAISARDVITARDSLEWYDNTQIAVARGDALDIRDGTKRIAGDTLTAQMVHPQGQEGHVSRVDAKGHVFVSSQDQIGRGDTGVYNADTDIATLAGNVRLTRNDNEMRGQYGVVDMNRNVGHLLPAPPGTTLTAGLKPRVQGLIYPRQQEPGAVAGKNGPKPATKPGVQPARGKPAKAGPAPASQAARAEP